MSTPNNGQPRQISPTDVAQYIRLEQCRRYLRLRLDERHYRRNMLRDYDVQPQALPPLLTRSGRTFEVRVQKAVSTRHPARDLQVESDGKGGRAPDNDAVLAECRDLEPGAIRVLFQPRLDVVVGGWQLRGDLDILRLERDHDGRLSILIADMKSSTSAKVEHRLQVAFYHQMVTGLLQEHGIEHEPIRLGILYRGPTDGDEGLDDNELARRHEERDAAQRLFSVGDALLELVEDLDSYLGAVADLVTRNGSTAEQVAEAYFPDVPYHLEHKCDGCLYNEYCMKWSAEEDDLSLLPYLTVGEKSALHAASIRSTRDLATLKEPVPGEKERLLPAPGRTQQVRRISATRGVGARLDELVHRARLFRRSQRDDIEALGYIPSKGYGTLPYAAPDHNPNLVRVYLDAQHDYLNDRIYMLGALVVACEGGTPVRRRSIVRLADGPPDTNERERDLFESWINETVSAIVDLAAPDEEGERRAPVHLIFHHSFEQRRLLEGLARHLDTLLGATPLYDFVTQLAAFDSPVATFLDQEIRELKNYPMLCQSLQSVARYLRFHWNTPEPYAEIFKERLFDYLGRLDDGSTDEKRWYTSRSRFSSQIPLEYAWAAWGTLEPPTSGTRDDYAPYRTATRTLLEGFQARRLDAMEHIAADFLGNKYTLKTLFELPTLGEIDPSRRTLAHAIREFVTIERHVVLADWKRRRLAPPERRVLSGDALIVRYHDADQDLETQENLRRWRLAERLSADFFRDNPGALKVTLTTEQKAATKWSKDTLDLRLRLDCTGLDCDLEEALGLSTLRERDSVIVYPRTAVDGRLPPEQQIPFTPTPKQMLYGLRGFVRGITRETGEANRATSGWVSLELRKPGGGKLAGGFGFSAMGGPLVDGEVYTLDADPNDIYGYWCSKVADGLVDGGRNTLYEYLTRTSATAPTWSSKVAEGQARFLQGLEALDAAGALHPFEAGKHEFIGQHGASPVLLVQGPPGTGKSYTTAWAVLARIQGAMAAGVPYRVFLSCKTHAATDVLIANVVTVQKKLDDLRYSHTDIFRQYFDRRLLDVPLYRMQPRETVDGTVALYKKDRRKDGDPRPTDAIMAQQWCVLAATPGGIYGMITDRWDTKKLFGHDLCDCLVLDEASQMNLPEAAMAALPLSPGGRLVVVGDPRQMPPIVQHDWVAEPRRTIKEYRTYESLYLTLEALNPPRIAFEESFRLHADMAEFLRREVYQHDNINYHSRRDEVLTAHPYADPFVAAVLAPQHPLVVIVHDEAVSQTRNEFERELVAPVLRALAGYPHDLGVEHGLGVVVPHRDQRAALQEIGELVRRDAATGAVKLSAVDTVERFQGGERDVIVVSATESDPAYLLAAAGFLLDPRRLTVALSRAKRKMILVASRSVFELFSTDEETFAHSQLWKNLLNRTCTQRLWTGSHHWEGTPVTVTVWGNTPDGSSPAAVDRTEPVGAGVHDREARVDAGRGVEWNDPMDRTDPADRAV